MVHSDLLDSIDEILRRFRDRAKPFGGVLLVVAINHLILLWYDRVG